MSTTAYVDSPPPNYIHQVRSEFRRFPDHARSYFSDMLPIINWLPKYNLLWLWGDLICGITIGAVVVPQSMAYAKIASLPPEYGLYSSFVGVVIYMFMGTSKDISIGTSAIMSLLFSQIFLGIQATPEFQSGEWTTHQFAVTMALFAGIISLGLSVLRLGILFHFICQPAVAGFMAGSGLTIVINQFSKIFGVSNINTSEAPYLVFGKTLINLNHSTVDAIFGVLSLIWLYGVRYLCQYLTKRYPQHARKFFFFNISRNVVVIVFTTFLSWLINHFGHYETSPFGILGPVPAGFQNMGVPEIDSGLVAEIMPNIPSVVTLLIMEHCSIATSLGKQSDYRINVNQEIMTIGLTNIFGSFFSAYPSTGSFSRSAVTSKSGARTPLTNIFVAIIVVLALYAFTPAFQYIPNASLAAIIAHAVTDLIVGPSVWRRFWRYHPSELVIFAAAYIIALFTRIDISVYVPVGLSLIVQLYRSARPEYAILGRVAMNPACDSEKKDAIQTDYDELADCRFFSFTHPTLGHCVRPIAPGIVAFQPRENMLFENSVYYSEKLLDEVQSTTQRGKPLAEKIGDRPWNDTGDTEKGPDKPLLRAIIIDMTGVHQMDYSAAEDLKATVKQVDRYSGRSIPWLFVLNDSMAVRKGLLYAGFGTQRRKVGGPFRSDLPKKKKQNNAGDNNSSSESGDENAGSDDSKDPGKAQQQVIEDIYKHHSSSKNNNSDAAVSSDDCDSSCWSNQQRCNCDTISHVDDVYPYFFVTMRDAACAAYVCNLDIPSSIASEHAPSVIDEEKGHSQHQQQHQEQH
ncbi:sulfate transporter family-domain-containing protein [Zychaea mexicana]|uniref:sulfate transporter family-domain-containing protein n=1 Tax=Zychaea mexicana TaxID=64656 RepID=UPI0022FDD382|nr:sulfate transporter family-domain-containing protein [Zychaea mexicana]KAI9490876.1 sulfate transporter family-domain-containing protein [Zychaea mexicana]